MAVDRITPNDSRVTHETATLNGRQYHYLLGIPKDGQFKATIFLVHGWPDLSFGWRYQIPMLLSLGLRVVAPDMMGYGGTDAPRVPPESMRLYGFKQAADDIAELARQLSAPHIIIGGHDWGGMIVYRTAQWHPELVTHVFSVCTPFMKNQSRYVSTEDLVNGPVPQFGYQLQLAGPDVEAAVKTPQQIEQFINGMYGARSDSGKAIFSEKTGLDLALIGRMGKTRLLNDEEVRYYVEQYSRTGLHGPLNWYRTREANFEDEKQLKSDTVEQPTLYILATADSVLTGEMSRGMEKQIPRLTRREVAAGHWALWQTADEVNGFIKDWLQSVVFGGKIVL